LSRAKTVDNDQWVQGYYLERDQTTYCFKEDYRAHPDNTKHYIAYDWMTDWGLPNEHLLIEVKPETVGQCVGRCDKNNKEIFEADIVLVNSMFVPAENNIFVVEWVTEWAGFALRNTFNMINFDTLDSDEIEIIGNIHDNLNLTHREQEVLHFYKW